MKKNIFKKIIALTYLVFLLFGFLSPVHFSLAEDTTSTYNLLAPLPDGNNGTMSTFDPTNANGDALTGYLNLMIKLFIGICAVLSVIMIVMGGIEYMTSELPGLKSDGKEKIINAIFGLILALGAWMLLNTINPKLLDSSLSNLKSTEEASTSN
jgi:hypothetical protein